MPDEVEFMRFWFLSGGSITVPNYRISRAIFEYDSDILSAEAIIDITYQDKRDLQSNGVLSTGNLEDEPHALSRFFTHHDVNTIDLLDENEEIFISLPFECDGFNSNMSVQVMPKHISLIIGKEE